MRYRALPDSSRAKASLILLIGKCSVCGVTLWREAKSSIVANATGEPAGEPEMLCCPKMSEKAATGIGSSMIRFKSGGRQMYRRSMLEPKSAGAMLTMFWMFQCILVALGRANWRLRVRGTGQKNRVNAVRTDHQQRVIKHQVRIFSNRRAAEARTVW